MTNMWSTVDELEARIGAQVRRRRLRANRTVEAIATEAGVAPRTVQNLERGRGSSIATLVKVLRALDAEDWLDTLTPDEPVSPIAVLEAARPRPERQRASRSDG
jgi:transcriptional regulator with XRE-family HTH domain